MLVIFLGRISHGIYNDYNYKQSSTRILVKQTIGRPKGIWKILHHPFVEPFQNLVLKLICVCCAKAQYYVKT
jgi:hypothetical protein